MNSASLPELLKRIHTELGIPADYQKRFKLPLYEEALLGDLVVAQLDDAGRPIVLTQQAAQAWNAMWEAASAEGIELKPFSGFRSYLYQRGIFISKLSRGIALDEILRSLAAPGYSEHHTGEAVDVTTTGCPLGQEVFASTSAYTWLVQNADRFGFQESFPAGNPHNLVYEPWHWRYHNSGD